VEVVMRVSARLAMVVAVAGGCGHGEVELEELGPFGPVRSAAWLDLTVGDQELHEFVAGNVPALCDQVTDGAAALQRAVDDWKPALDAASGDPDRVCEAERTFYTDAGRATRTLLRATSQFVTMVLDDREGDPEDPPKDGPYEIGDVDDPSLVGWYTALDRNPFDEALDAGCTGGSLDGATQAVVARYVAEVGTAEADLRTPDRYRITLDTMLARDDGSSRGHLGLVARFDRCVLDLEPGVLPYLPFVTAIGEP
jgi:hypothetical protein